LVIDVTADVGGGAGHAPRHHFQSFPQVGHRLFLPVGRGLIERGQEIGQLVLQKRSAVREVPAGGEDVPEDGGVGGDLGVAIAGFLRGGRLFLPEEDVHAEFPVGVLRPSDRLFLPPEPFQQLFQGLDPLIFCRPPLRADPAPLHLYVGEGVRSGRSESRFCLDGFFLRGDPIGSADR